MGAEEQGARLGARRRKALLELEEVRREVDVAREGGGERLGAGEGRGVRRARGVREGGEEGGRGEDLG